MAVAEGQSGRHRPKKLSRVPSEASRGQKGHFVPDFGAPFGPIFGPDPSRAALKIVKKPLVFITFLALGGPGGGLGGGRKLAEKRRRQAAV